MIEDATELKDLAKGKPEAIEAFRRRFGERLEAARTANESAAATGIGPAEYAATLGARAALSWLAAKAPAASFDSFVERLVANDDYFLALALKKGGDAAWNRFRERFGPFLRDIFVRSGRSPVEAGALVDEVVAEVRRGGTPEARFGAAEWDGASSLEAWLFVFIRRAFGAGVGEALTRAGAVPVHEDPDSAPGLGLASVADVEAIEQAFDEIWTSLDPTTRRRLSRAAAGDLDDSRTGGFDLAATADSVYAQVIDAAAARTGTARDDLERAAIATALDDCTHHLKTSGGIVFRYGDAKLGEWLALSGWIRDGGHCDQEALDLHLGANETAALIDGAPVDAERRRLRDHLLACVPCRDAIETARADWRVARDRTLRAEDFEASRRTRLPMRVTRRWSPLVLAVLVFAVGVLVPFGLVKWLRRGEVAVPVRLLVMSRVGSPVIRLPDDSARSAETAALVDRGAILYFEAGDLVTALGEDGALYRGTRRGIEVTEPPDAFFKELFAKCAADRDLIDSERDLPPSEPQRFARAPTIVHPHGLVSDAQPSIRLADDSPAEAYEIVIIRDGPAPEIVLKEKAARLDFRFPRRAPPLEAGKSYRIEVRPYPLDRGVLSTTTFKVVEKSEADRFDAELRRIDRRFGRGTAFLRAEYLRQNGLLSEAAETVETMRRDDMANLCLLAVAKHLYRRLGLASEEWRCAKILAKRAR